LAKSELKFEIMKNYQKNWMQALTYGCKHKTVEKYACRDAI